MHKLAYYIIYYGCVADSCYLWRFIFVGSQANGRFDPGVSLLKNFDLDDDGKVAFSEFAKLFGVDV
jgi:hypothetical protein